MSIDCQPIVSIGLPVYNGEKYLSQTIESLVSQTFKEFELIISDNASTDSTPVICREYAGKDRRIRYHRFEQNVGAARNYNYVFERSHGKFFKWAAHDDLCSPEFIARCLDALQHDRSAVLSYPKVIIIDAEGKPLKEYDEGKDLQSESPYERFASLILAPGECNAVFGLIRSEVLSKTQLIGVYNASDRNLLAELALRGRFREVPERLFFRREHPQRPLYVAKTDSERVAWFDPTKEKSIVLPICRRFFEYIKSVWQVRLKIKDKVHCCVLITKIVFWNRYELTLELKAAFVKFIQKVKLEKSHFC